MQICAAFEELFHVALDLWFREMHARVLQKSGKIVVHVGCDHEKTRLLVGAGTLGSFDSHLH